MREAMRYAFFLQKELLKKDAVYLRCCRETRQELAGATFPAGAVRGQARARASPWCRGRAATTVPPGPAAACALLAACAGTPVGPCPHGRSGSRAEVCACVWSDLPRHVLSQQEWQVLV